MRPNYNPFSQNEGEWDLDAGAVLDGLGRGRRKKPGGCGLVFLFGVEGGEGASGWILFFWGDAGAVLDGLGRV